MPLDFFNAVLGWLVTGIGGPASRRLHGALLGNDRERELRALVGVAITNTVAGLAEGIDPRTCAQLRMSLLERGGELVGTAPLDLTDLTHAVRGWVAPLDEPVFGGPSYLAEIGVDPDDVVLRLVGEIRRGLDANARLAGALAPVADWIWRNELWNRMERRFDRMDKAIEAIAQSRSVTTTAYRQLPMDIAEFTGRRTQLDMLEGLVAELSSAATDAPVVLVITGMAGVGKTKLAIHAAHRLVRAGRFDEIQLHVDLGGFDEAEQAADPAAVLDRFLRLLGVPPEQIPVDVDGRSAMYRDRLSGRRALVLLDNAASRQQVEHLLPGDSGHLALITSRRNLDTVDGSRALYLDPFASEESTSLITWIAGRERVHAELGPTAEVAELCAHLPYAVALAARRLSTRPTWQVADLAALLRPADQRLGELARKDRAIRVLFDLSYRAVSAPHRRLLSLLSLHPGEDSTAPSAGALANLPAARAKNLLEDLLDENLLVQTTPGRYRLHDLVRLYAAERLQDDENTEDQEQAVERVLNWYLRTADSADRMLGQRARRPELPTGTPAALSFADHVQALRWCERERANLVAATNLAAATGSDATAWKLAVTLWPFMQLGSHRTDWRTTHETGLESARRQGDEVAEAWILNGLAILHENLDQFAQAVDLGRAALAIRRRGDDRFGLADSLHELGVVYQQVDRYDEAAECLEQALELRRQLGDRNGEATALNSLGSLAWHGKRYVEAAERYRQALAINRETGDRAGEAVALGNIGEAYASDGRHEEAISYLEQAVAQFGELQNGRFQAWTLTLLGQTLKRAGQREKAQICLDAASEINQTLEH
ncbi:tetratricopeptide repeat protein [Micromonospora sp. NPDC004704]